MIWNEYQDYLVEKLNLNLTLEQNHSTDSISLESKIYSNEYIHKSRETYIKENPSYIYNNIIYPNTGKNLPCFGIDLMCFFEKKVIIVFDFQHPKENYDFNHPIVEEYLGDMLDNTTEPIRFFQPGNHFSRYIYVRKCSIKEISQHFPLFKRYIDVYNILLNEEKPNEFEESDYHELDTYMHELDPVYGYLNSKFDRQFADSYVKDFLFPYSKLNK